MVNLLDILSAAQGQELKFVFDCYGTLIDWQGGLKKAFIESFPELSHLADEFLRVWMKADLLNVRRLKGEPYRSILFRNTSSALESLGIEFSTEQLEGIALSIYRWEPFPDVPEALPRIKALGIKVIIMSNTDEEFLMASAGKLIAKPDLLIPCSKLGYYKPNEEAWKKAMEVYKLDPEGWFQVSAYPQYDLIPARNLGLGTILVNRYSEDFPADIVVKDLMELVGWRRK